MLSYPRVILTLIISAIVFHTIWVIPAFIRYSDNKIAKQIFEIVHPGAKYATVQGYFVSDLWIALYVTVAAVIFVFFNNYIQRLLNKKSA